MINWFGPTSWGAPICEDAPRCDIPVGTLCARCHQPFDAGSSGITMPGIPGPAAYHHVCHLKSVLPHTQWPHFGLVPDASDGLVGGRFRCAHCRMVYTEAAGWTWGVAFGWGTNEHG